MLQVCMRFWTRPPGPWVACACSVERFSNQRSPPTVQAGNVAMQHM